MRKSAQTICQSNARGDAQGCAWGRITFLLIPVLLAAGLLLPAGLASADVIFFKGKGVLHGRVVEEQRDNVFIELYGGGRIGVDKSYIREILHETEVVYLLKKGDFWFSQGDFHQAEENYSKALDLDPGNSDVVRRLQQLSRGKKIRQVREMYVQAVNHMESGDYRQVVNLLDEALAICPDEEQALIRQIEHEKAKAHAKLAFFFYNRCYDDWAIEELELAEALDPSIGEIFFVYARIYHYQDKLEDAARSYRKALDLDPGNELAQNYLLQVQERAKEQRRFL